MLVMQKVEAFFMCCPSKALYREKETDSDMKAISQHEHQLHISAIIISSRSVRDIVLDTGC